MQRVPKLLMDDCDGLSTLDKGFKQGHRFGVASELTKNNGSEVIAFGVSGMDRENGIHLFKRKIEVAIVEEPLSLIKRRLISAGVLVGHRQCDVD